MIKRARILHRHHRETYTSHACHIADLSVYDGRLDVMRRAWQTKDEPIVGCIAVGRANVEEGYEGALVTGRCVWCWHFANCWLG